MYFKPHVVRRTIGDSYEYSPSFDCPDCAERLYHETVEKYPNDLVELLSYGDRNWLQSQPTVVLSSQGKEQRCT